MNKELQGTITRHIKVSWSDAMKVLEEIYGSFDTEDLAIMISLRDAERLQVMGKVIQEAIEKHRQQKKG